MLGLVLLCLAVFVPPLYGTMEANNCGFDDRLLEVNKTERSGLGPDEKNFYDWSEYEIGSTGVISVPYYFKSKPSKWVRSVVKAGLRYIEENVSCIKFKNTRRRKRRRKDSPKKQVEMKIPSSGTCKWTERPSGRVSKRDTKNGRRRVYLKMFDKPCEQKNWNKDSIEPLSGWHQIFIHELFHVFGIAHTMRRTDRDNYIEVSDRKLEDHQFRKDALIPMPGGGEIPYECNSIMHYRPKGNPPDFKARDPKTCKFNFNGPTDNDWKALKYKVCTKLKGFSDDSDSSD